MLGELCEAEPVQCKAGPLQRAGGASTPTAGPTTPEAVGYAFIAAPLGVAPKHAASLSSCACRR